jgi:hypothetical protein
MATTVVADPGALAALVVMEELAGPVIRVLLVSEETLVAKLAQ